MARQYRTFREATIEQLKNDPEALDAYLEVIIEEFETDHDIGAFLRSLRNATEALGGMTWLAEQTKLNRQHLYEILSEKGNPKFETLEQIMRTLGYRISFERIDSPSTHVHH